MFIAFKKSIWFLNVFFASKCFITRRECVAYPVGVQLFLLVIYWVRKCLESFKNQYGFSNFFLLKNVLFDGMRWDGVGWGGWDGPSKGSFNFFHFKTYYTLYLDKLIHI